MNIKIDPEKVEAVMLSDGGGWRRVEIYENDGTSLRFGSIEIEGMNSSNVGFSFVDETHEQQIIGPIDSIIALKMVK